MLVNRLGMNPSALVGQHGEDLRCSEYLSGGDRLNIIAQIMFGHKN